MSGRSLCPYADCSSVRSGPRPSASRSSPSCCAFQLGLAPPTEAYIVVCANHLGMHCMQNDFSQMMILPPFNTFRAQVAIKCGGEPDIVTSGLTIEYRLPTNTHSSDKTNFWKYAPALLFLRRTSHRTSVLLALECPARWQLIRPTRATSPQAYQLHPSTTMARRTRTPL